MNYIWIEHSRDGKKNSYCHLVFHRDSTVRNNSRQLLLKIARKGGDLPVFSHIFLLVVSSAGGVYKQGTPVADVSTDRVQCMLFHFPRRRTSRFVFGRRRERQWGSYHYVIFSTGIISIKGKSNLICNRFIKKLQCHKVVCKLAYDSQTPHTFLFRETTKHMSDGKAYDTRDNYLYTAMITTLSCKGRKEIIKQSNLPVNIRIFACEQFKHVRTRVEIAVLDDKRLFGVNCFYVYSKQQKRPRIIASLIKHVEKFK